MLKNDALTFLHIVFSSRIASCLDCDKPVVIVGWLVSPTASVSVTHQQPGMILDAFLCRGEIAEFLVFAVIIMNAVG